MITDVVPAKLVQPPIVTVTEYVPAIADEAFVSAGFCKVDENALGPVQLYVAPVTVGVDKFNVENAQTGVLLLAVGVAGIAFIIIVTPVLVPVVGLAHNAFDVNTQVTIWPFVSVVEVNVELLVPTFAPLTFH
jgi:hypothetical protein